VGLARAVGLGTLVDSGCVAAEVAAAAGVTTAIGAIAEANCQSKVIASATVICVHRPESATVRVRDTDGGNNRWCSC
jgi:hypothetical protein